MDILITKPDKEDGVIIANRAIHMSSLYKIINDTPKFLKIPYYWERRETSKISTYFEQERLFQ